MQGTKEAEGSAQHVLGVGRTKEAYRRLDVGGTRRRTATTVCLVGVNTLGVSDPLCGLKRMKTESVPAKTARFAVLMILLSVYITILTQPVVPLPLR